MFGQNNNQDDSTKIPEQTIDAALSDQAAQSPATDWQHPGKPLDDSTAPATDTPVSQAADDTPAVVTPSTTVEPAHDTVGSPNDLIDIKQQALSQLAPLVDHLDQTPEERFRTTMMMIQASDDQSLVKDAYTAAQAITDDKARAQALLDIINEINYFTQHAE